MNAFGWVQSPPICSRTALTDIMLQYKRLTSSSADRTVMPFVATTFNDAKVRFGYQE
jgi:hypothetical protein